MANVRELLHVATQRVGDRNEANLLLAHTLGVQRSWLIAHSDDPLALEQETRFLNLIARREAGEPVAYLTGSRGFWTLELEVTPATLIPRPETELLVELALARLHESESLRVVDLGTGSGAIALAIARERPQAQVIAVDASEDALAVARRNADRHGLRNVQFLHGDWLAPIGAQKVTMIVSNPPYIEADDRHLGEGDLRFEPLSALASGADGLDDIRRIITSAAQHLLPNGHLLLEHGWQQGHEVRQLLKAAGFVEVATANDLEERERVTLGMWPVVPGEHMPAAPH